MTDTTPDKKLVDAAYVGPLEALAVKCGDGRIYTVPLADLAGVDASPIRRVSISPDGEAAHIEQFSGNRTEVPWGAVLNHAEPEYTFYPHLESDHEHEKRAEAGGRSTGVVIGECIRAERLKRSWTLERMSQLTGIKAPNLSRLEKGKHLPSLETLEKVAEAFDMPVAALVVASRTAGP